MSEKLAQALGIIAKGAGAFGSVNNAFSGAGQPPPTTAPLPSSTDQLNTLFDPSLLDPRGSGQYDSLEYYPKANNLGGLGGKLGKGLIKYGR